MKITESNKAAAAKWAAETGADEAERNETPWTKSEVSEYHEGACQAVSALERAVLDDLFAAAGNEAGVVEYLSYHSGTAAKKVAK